VAGDISTPRSSNMKTINIIPPLHAAIAASLPPSSPIANYGLPKKARKIFPASFNGLKNNSANAQKSVKQTA
jgi:hypothetical protein